MQKNLKITWDTRLVIQYYLLNNLFLKYLNFWGVFFRVASSPRGREGIRVVGLLRGVFWLGFCRAPERLTIYIIEKLGAMSWIRNPLVTPNFSKHQWFFCIKNCLLLIKLSIQFSLIVYIKFNPKLSMKILNKLYIWQLFLNI